MLLKAISQVLNYDWHLEHKTSSDSLVKLTFDEMLELPLQKGGGRSTRKNYPNNPIRSTPDSKRR